MTHQAGAYPGFCKMKRLGVFLLVHRRVTPSIKVTGINLYTWVERGTVRVKRLAQEHNTMSPAMARTRTARSGDERTNHEATAPPLRSRAFALIISILPCLCTPYYYTRKVDHHMDFSFSEAYELLCCLCL